MLDPTIKANWVKALRSGEYKQGRGKLRSGRGEYCCLGVLCEVAALDISTAGTTVVGASSYSVFTDLIGDSRAVDELWRMNDRKRKSFAEIAAHIEEHL